MPKLRRPKGRHRYLHRIYALDTELGDLRRPDKQLLKQAMADHVLAEAVLIGTFQKY